MSVQRLQAILGVPTNLAQEIVGSFDANWIQRVLNFIESLGEAEVPIARAAIVQALPLILKGDTAGAMISIINYMLTHQPTIPSSSTPDLIPETGGVQVETGGAEAEDYVPAPKKKK